MSARNNNWVPWTLVVVAVAVGLLVWKLSRDGGDPPVCPIGLEPSQEEVTAQAEHARHFHHEQHWCDALNAWEKLLRTVDGWPQYSAFREEASGNREIARANCHPAKTPVDKTQVSPPKNPPSPIPEDAIAQFYKVGKTVRSIAYLNITGSGTNARFVLKGTTNFAYQYRVAIETKVIENRRTAVVFEQHFQDVVQLRAESTKELELVLPESPIVTVVWREIEEQMLKPIPGYTVAKRIAALINTVDPGLKRTLTQFQDQLRQYGKPLLPDDQEDLPVVATISQFTGQRVQIEYVSGLGVAQIKVLDGKKFSPDDLERLAYASSLMMDYFLHDGLKKADDEPFEIRAEDIQGLCGLGLGVGASGALNFKKKTDADLEGEPMTVIDVVGGEVSIQDRSGRSGRIKPLPGGFVYYSPEKVLVRQARISWTGDAEWFSDDSLLFRTSRVRNVKIDTYYEAYLVGPPHE